MGGDSLSSGPAPGGGPDPSMGGYLGGPGAGGQMPPLPPGSLKQEPGQYGLTSL